MARSRRDEVQSDIHEQYADAAARGVAASETDRAVTSRAVRGVAADIAWSWRERRRMTRAWRLAALGEPSAAKWYRAAVAYSAVVWIAAAFVLTRIVMTLIDASTSTHNRLSPLLYQEPAFALVVVSMGVLLLVRTRWMRLGIWISSAAAIYLAATSYLLLGFISVRGSYYLYRGLNLVGMSFDVSWALFVLPTVVLAVVFAFGSLRLPRGSKSRELAEARGSDL
jgi:hypothetical protein